MKKAILTLAAILSTLAAIAQDGKSIYRKYSDEKGVEAVYISPAMFRLIGSIPQLMVDTEKGEVNLSPIIKSLSGFYVITTSDDSLKERLFDDVSRMRKAAGFEHLMEAKSHGETMQMYMTTKGEDATSLVMETKSGKGDSSFICMDGVIPLKDLEALISKVK